MTTLNTRDTLFYGWQDNKFVLLVMRDDKIAHRISLDSAEANRVSLEIVEPSGKTQHFKNHKQVDSDVLPHEYTRAKRYKPQKGLPLPPLYENSRYKGDIIVSKLNNEVAFSNGHLILTGEPPEGKRTAQQPKFDDFLKYAFNAEPLKFVCAQAVSKNEWEELGADEATATVVIWFDKGQPVDSRYFDYVLERYPKAVFARQDTEDEKTPLVIYSSNDADDVQGKIVGFLMAMRYEPSEFVEMLRAELDTRPATT